MATCKLFSVIFLTLFCLTITDSKAQYFQQEVNSVINTTLHVNKRELHSEITIQYINNSPDTLSFIYFHLWPNAYSSDRTALARQLSEYSGKRHIFDKEKRGFIDSLSFKVDGYNASIEYLKEDICKLLLPGPVGPGDTLFITTPFKVKIPEGNFSRMGYTGGIFQVSQWYPKPAVYDINGWHPMSYLDQGEFYSEFGSFDVTITLPADLVVGASGKLITESEKLWLHNYASSWRAEQFADSQYDSNKTIRFKADGVHDFAWVAGKQFRIGQDSLVLPSGRSIEINVLYTSDQAAVWSNALSYVKRSLLTFSEWTGDYPYDVFTAIQAPLGAGAGMEYPAMAVIGYSEDEYSLDEVIAHEVCHNWFYSALGNDERNYPYMDEGLTSAMESRYMQKFYPEKKLWEVYFQNIKFAKVFGIEEMPVGRSTEIEWLIPAMENIEQPLNLAAEEFTIANYSSMIYNKAGQSFNFLRAYLGNDLFDSIMNQYYSQWKGKHPSPPDLEEAFKRTGKNLDWFFTDYLQTVKRTDYRIKKIDGGNVIIRNKGETVSPFKISIYSGNKVTDYWSGGFKGIKEIKIPGGRYNELKINADHAMPEINLLDNNIKSAGILKKYDPVKFKLLFSLYDPAERPVFFAPLVSWVRANGLLVGAVFNSGFMMSRKFEYSVMPFYTSRDHELAGKGMVRFNLLPYDFFLRKVSFSLSASMFGFDNNTNYKVLSGGADFYFNEQNPASLLSKQISLNYYNVSDLVSLSSDSMHSDNSFLAASFLFRKKSNINPWGIRLYSESGPSFHKMTVDFNYKISYGGRNNGLDLFFLTGGMISENKNIRLYSMAPSARNGNQLYLFEGDFPDRFVARYGTFWSKQMLFREGRIVSPINEYSGYSRWLASFSAQAGLPGFASILPVRPFTNLSISNDIFYEAGISAGVQGVLEIFVPVLVSKNIQRHYPEINQRIRFILSLESLIRLGPGV